MFVIQGLNLETEETWVHSRYHSISEARMILAGLRRRRGPWNTDPEVHAIVDPATKKPHRRPGMFSLAWLNVIKR